MLEPGKIYKLNITKNYVAYYSLKEFEVIDGDFFDANCFFASCGFKNKEKILVLQRGIYKGYIGNTDEATFIPIYVVFMFTTGETRVVANWYKSKFFDTSFTEIKL